MVASTSVNGAWAVVLTSTNQYIKGVIAIKHALHNLHKSQYPLLVLYTSAVAPQAVQTLKKIGCIVKEIEPIHPSGKVDYKSERFTETWTKLAVWGQDEYERLVLLDADMLPLQNMDELMQVPLPNKDWVAASHACICNPQKIKHYPSNWIPENCAYTGCDTSACINPRSADNGYSYFNSGLIVLTPSGDKLAFMLQYLNSISDLNIYPFPDQDFLNEIFNNQWRPLPYTYNALKTLQWAHKPMWSLPHIKNVHYIITKPWDIDLDHDLNDLENIYRPLYELWWASYNRITKSIYAPEEMNQAML